MLELYFENWNSFSKFMEELNFSFEEYGPQEMEFYHENGFFVVKWKDNPVLPSNLLNKHTKWFNQL